MPPALLRVSAQLGEFVVEQRVALDTLTSSATPYRFETGDR
jgi:hypothetical protein